MQKWKNSNATYWVIHKHGVAIEKCTKGENQVENECVCPSVYSNSQVAGLGQ